MPGFKDVLYFKIPVQYFIMDKNFYIYLGEKKFIYNGNKKIQPKEIAKSFYNGIPMKIRYDVDQDNTIFIDFEITYLPDEDKVEGIRL